MKRYIGAAVAALTLLGASRAAAQERKITRAALPPAVAQTVARESRGATVRGLAEEKEKGQTFYEAELMVQGRHRDVLMDSTGAVVEIEEEVAVADLPAPVRTALQRAAAGAKVERVESLTSHGTLEAYEATVVRGGKHGEIKIAPDGTIKDADRGGEQEQGQGKEADED